MSTSGLSETALAAHRRDEFERRRLAGKPLRILVTGSHTFFGGRMIQALGEAGCEVTAADAVRMSCGKLSRHAHSALTVPPLRTDPDGLVRALVDELHARSYDLLLTTFEESILLSDRRHEFDPLVRTMLPQPDVAWNLHHKGRLHLFCRDVGISTPPTLLADDPATWREVASQLGFPAFVKPAVGLGSIARSRCPDERCVLEGFACVARAGLGVEPLLQRAIDGRVVSVLLFCHEGRILGELLYRSLRTFPDDCGTSAHRESVEHAGVSRTARQLVEATGWSGFLGLDVVVENGTDRCYLIDANPRITPGVQLGFVAGIDWSHLVTELVLGRVPEPVTARPGVRARSVVFDTAWLLEGFWPRKGWLRTGMGRLRKYLRPDWTLDSSIDLVDRGDWKAKAAMCAYTLSCVANGALGGKSMGDLLFRESTYDRRTATANVPPRPHDRATEAAPAAPVATRAKPQHAVAPRG